MQQEEFTSELRSRLSAIGRSDEEIVAVVVSLCAERGMLQNDQQLALIPQAPRAVGRPKKPATVEADKRAQAFFAVYITAYKKRYNGSRPEIHPKYHKQIPDYLKYTSLDRALALVQVYLQMNEKWFVTKFHDLGTYLENVAKIGVALDAGGEQGSSKGIEDLLKEQP